MLVRVNRLAYFVSVSVSVFRNFVGVVKQPEHRDVGFVDLPLRVAITSPIRVLLEFGIVGKLRSIYRCALILRICKLSALSAFASLCFYKAGIGSCWNSVFVVIFLNRPALRLTQQKETWTKRLL